MPWRIRAAGVSPTAGVVRRTLLDPGQAAQRPLGRVRVVAFGDRVAAGWSGIVGSAHPMQVAFGNGQGTGQAPVTLAGDGALGDLAAGPQGSLLATWLTAPRYDGAGATPPTQAMSAVVLPGTREFSAAEPLAAPDVASPPHAAFLPDGRAVAVWAARPTGQDQSNGIGRTAVLRVALRPADPLPDR